MNPCLFLLMPALVWAAPFTKSIVHEISEGRNLYVQIAQPSPGKATFLFLPGMNRAPMIDEPAAQALIRGGYGVVTFNFSVQPLSIATLEAKTKPDFYDDGISLRYLGEEIESLAEAVKSEFAIRNLIPVSLSYSGAVSRFIKGFDDVVDAVPLTSTDADNPTLAQYRRALQASELMMGPIMGPANTRYWLDQSYRTVWVPQVRKISEQYKLPAERADEMVDGYVHLSRAVEGFEWDNKGDRVKRTFILAGDESGSLMRHQVDTILERLAARNEAVVLVKESGHIISTDQPEVYAKILEAKAEGKLKPGLTVVTPSTGRWEHYPAEKAKEILRR